MTVNIMYNSAYGILLASEFFLARRPVMDRTHTPVAHELLFCSVAADGAACVSAIDPEQPAEASVIESVAKFGLSRVLGDLLGVLYIDETALMSDSIRLLPSHSFILEFAPQRAISDQTVARIEQLVGAGYRFGLVLDRRMPGDERLLPLVTGVRFDISGKDEAALRQLCQPHQAQGKRLFADNVETIEQFEMCSRVGFDFFRGYYFTAPQILAGKKLSPSQVAITELLALLASDADDAAIEHAIKGDVSLGLNLLRLANTPVFSVHRVDSLRQALKALGRDQLQRWLQVMLYADPAAEGVGLRALSSLATTRGRLMELIAQKRMPGNRSVADTAFTVGVMSLMDTLFSMPMEEILRQMPVVDEVAEALLERQGYHGRLLTLVEYTEWRRSSDLLLPAMRALKLSYDELYLLQLDAFEWSDQVTRSIH
jgi:EAL and modified HD-GYP domain-containing signal transduction protein